MVRRIVVFAALACFIFAGSTGMSEEVPKIKFEDLLHKKFIHARCMNCHSFNAQMESGQKRQEEYSAEIKKTWKNKEISVDKRKEEVAKIKEVMNKEIGLFITHNPRSTTCTDCHIEKWRAPPKEMDFRPLAGKPQELCARVKTSMENRISKTKTLAEAMTEHLTEDTLIIWAVASGILPADIEPDPIGKPADPAEKFIPKKALDDWFDEVKNWTKNGMQGCP